MEYKHDILFEFLTQEDKNNFLVWDNVMLSTNGNIVATYRAPFDERILDILKNEPQRSWFEEFKN